MREDRTQSQRNRNGIARFKNVQGKDPQKEARCSPCCRDDSTLADSVAIPLRFRAIPAIFPHQW